MHPRRVASSSRRSILAWATVLSVATTLPAGAAEPDAVPGISHKPLLTVQKRAPELERKVMGVLEGLLRTPQLADLKGASAHPSITIEPNSKLKVTKASVSLLLKPIFKNDRETVVDKKTGRYQGVGEGSLLEIRVNALSRLSFDTSIPDNLYYEPTRVKEHQGLPVYQVGGETPFLLITAKDRHPWRRVTVSEYLARLVREGGSDAAEAKKQAAQLTGGAGDKPACVPRKRTEIVGNCEGPNATYYITWNSKYFDPKKPDAIQLVIVYMGHASHKTQDERYYQQHPLDPFTQLARAYEQYDWSQVARLVE
ncbi:hypothetical protein JRI60_27175 [Archangium violaceum]|uniref:hypothetical protein n=1 Tax=Archangium violaceum TaxID=83451 RepID=UPI0019511C0C|nr:hypothetical protein [Archangium violaceum]QRN92895.1 hypothetical protein JRI60_27175 [Archangium violaceum]